MEHPHIHIELSGDIFSEPTKQPFLDRAINAILFGLIAGLLIGLIINASIILAAVFR